MIYNSSPTLDDPTEVELELKLKLELDLDSGDAECAEHADGAVHVARLVKLLERCTSGATAFFDFLAALGGGLGARARGTMSTW